MDSTQINHHCTSRFWISDLSLCFKMQATQRGLAWEIKAKFHAFHPVKIKERMGKVYESLFVLDLGC